MDYPIAVLDASVLFSASLRDILMRLAARRIYAPRWTEMIHHEWIEAGLKRRPDITRERLERTKRRNPQSKSKQIRLLRCESKILGRRDLI